jgi:hypothetical protein
LIETKSENEKMSLTLSANDVETLVENIKSAGMGRSYSACKKDLRRFLLNHFGKLSKKSGSTKRSGSTSSSGSDKPKKVTEKKAKATKATKAKSSTSGDRSFKIKSVSPAAKFPTTTYKVSQPIDAAEKAFKGIVRKNEVDASTCNFKFILRETGSNRDWKYSVAKGKLKSR